MLRKDKLVFKPYNPNQAMLLPPSLEELISQEHPVRVVSDVIDRIDIDPLLAKFKGGGTSSYHPKMLLKVLIYAYINNIYSSRKIEACLKENIHYMWLAGMSQPDHNTINRFRSDRLSGVIKPIFSQVVMMLSKAGLVDLHELYVDGTKIEANANRFTFVWGKSIKTSKERMVKQLEELWQYVQQITEQDLKDTAITEFTKIDVDSVNEAIRKIDEALKDNNADKKIKQKVNYAKKHWPENLKKYDEQQQILGNRNSFSKTDPDATFMRMKEDYMNKGQLKPGYNLQISTNKQIITNFTLHPNPTDTTTLIAHLEEGKRLYNHLPKVVTADSGYGSYENYNYLLNQNIKPFVKYPLFHKEQKQKNPNPFSSENFHYNKDKNVFYCPMGQQMIYKGEKVKSTETGFKQTLSIYEAQNCSGCPLRGKCHKGQGNRRITINLTMRQWKSRIKSDLLSEEGVKHRKQRPADVEAVFGNIKHNKRFKRFNLRGKMKTELEFGLIAIAHNLRKLAS